MHELALHAAYGELQSRHQQSFKAAPGMAT
jgi:hypothetical protein